MLSRHGRDKQTRKTVEKQDAFFPLQAFVQRVRGEIAKLDSPEDTAAKVVLLQRMVRGRLGLLSPGDKQQHSQSQAQSRRAAAAAAAEVEDRCRAAMWSLQRQRRSRVVSLGSIRIGVSRHQVRFIIY